MWEWYLVHERYKRDNKTTCIQNMRASNSMCILHVKSLQSCPTLWDTMDCSLTGSSVYGDSPGKNTRVGCHALLQDIFPTQRLNRHLMRLLHCRRILYHWTTIRLLQLPVFKIREISTKKAYFHWDYNEILITDIPPSSDHFSLVKLCNITYQRSGILLGCIFRFLPELTVSKDLELY